MATAVIDRQSVERECANYLFREAELLDRRQFSDWHALLSANIDYRIPVRTTRYSRDGDGFSSTAFFMKEDYDSLELRITRLKSDYAWSENPPTRTRRIIGNIRVGGTSSTVDRFDVASNFAVYCFRGESAIPIVLTGERQDVLIRSEGSLALARRLVLLDTTILGVSSLSIFL